MVKEVYFFTEMGYTAYPQEEACYQSIPGGHREGETGLKGKA